MKEEIDLQVLTLLGPKGEEDLVKPQKEKKPEKKEKSDNVDSAPVPGKFGEYKLMLFPCVFWVAYLFCFVSMG